MPDEPPGPEAAGSEEAAPRGGRSLITSAVMRSLDGKLEVEVEEVLSGQDQLGRGILTAILENGRFSVDPLNLEVPGDSVDVSFTLEPTDRDVSLEAKASIDQLDYGNWPGGSIRNRQLAA